MTKPFLHTLIPLLFNLAFFAVAATPVETFGCRNRGLIALAIAFTSLLLGLAAALTGLIRRARQMPGHGWWILSAALFTVPPVALVLLA